MPPGDVGESDELVGVGVRRRCVAEGRAEAERPVTHGRIDERAHPLELLWGRSSVIVRALVDPDARRAYEGRDVRRDPARGDRLQRLGERRPGDVVLDVTLLLGLLAPHGVVHRTERPAFAEDLQRDALADVALRSTVGD